MRRKRSPIRTSVFGACLVAAAGLTLPQQGAAQWRPVEFGIDGAVSVTRVEARSDPRPSDIQTWAFPAQRFRIGRALVDRLESQLSMGFSVADFGEISTVGFSAALAGLYRVTGAGPRSGVFISLGTGMDLLSHNGTDVQWKVGGGVGVRVALGDRFAFRPGLEMDRAFANGARPAATSFSALFGLSAFTGPGEPGS